MSLRALRRHQLEAVDLHELALQRRCDVVGYGLGTGAGIIGLDLNDRIIDGREIIDGELPVRREAGDEHRQRQ